MDGTGRSCQKRILLGAITGKLEEETDDWIKALVDVGTQAKKGTVGENSSQEVRKKEKESRSPKKNQVGLMLSGKLGGSN